MTKLIATVSMDKIDSKPVVRFKKGDAFVKIGKVLLEEAKRKVESIIIG